MITSNEPWRSDLIIKRTLLVSLVLHVLILATAFDLGAHLIAAAIKQHVKPRDKEIVTISSAVTIAKRPKPVPVQPAAGHHRQAAQAGTPQRVAALPQPQQVPQQPAARQAPHELAKPVEHAPPQPPRPVQHPARSLADAPARTPEPSKHRAARQLALAEPPAQPGAGRMSQEQLAKIEEDLAKTIAQARSATDPLHAVPRETPAAPKHYGLQMQGVFGTLQHGEGWYHPISQWRSGGWDWYYVAYEFTYTDGTFEQGDVPWPIRFPPRSDPFAHPDVVALRHTPLPPPLPDFELTPQQAASLGKALRPYFPNLTFANNNQ